MKRLGFLVGLIVLGLSISTCARAPHEATVTPTPRNETVEQELMKREQEWNDADLKDDWAAMDGILADDYILTDGNGEVYTKSQCKAEYGSEEGRIVALEIDDMKVRAYGDAAVVTMRARIKEMRNGEETNGVFRITNTWIKRAGRWQCVATHSSRMAVEH
jgi:ketosteroid isomerase-like protein